MKRRWLVLVLAILGVSIAVVNAQFSRDFSEEFLNSATGRAFIQSYGALRSSYLSEVDDEKVVEGAIRGMLEALEDPYTSYSTPQESARRNQDLTGSFEGIGAVLSARNRTEGTVVEVINVYRDGPAWNAGIQRGDIFVEVDGVDVSEATVSEVVELVRGPRGTAVEIGMLRSGSEEPVYFSIVRDTIQIIDVESTVLPDGVGYISIRSFGNQRIHDQLTAELEELRQANITALILDLRDNPGGLLTQGILVADEFLSEGDIVFQRARGVTQRLASADQHAFDLPMVVLVNKNSASASEIVAGALQDNDRAIVVGEETFGKGVGQTVLPLTNGGQLTLLSFEWLTPDRQSINQQGVVPDVRAEDTRFPSVITLSGNGATPGQEIEIVVGGEVLGTATADEEGAFSFFQPQQRGDLSEVQGEALVNLEADNALRIAYETVMESVVATNP
jgi:carboxyl-terminal processing protease